LFVINSTLLCQKLPPYTIKEKKIQQLFDAIVHRTVKRLSGTNLAELVDEGIVTKTKKKTINKYKLAKFI
jgi:hypothetical protein